MVQEELGKFYLEQEDYQQSYEQLKICYEVRKKIYMSKRHKDVDRVATLLVLLHRKIEVQIVKYMKEQKNGGLKLLEDIGKKLHTTIQEGYETGFSIEDNFDFLKPPAEGDQSNEGGEIGDQVMWEMLANHKLPNT